MMKERGYSLIIIEFDKHWDCVDGFCRILSGTTHELHVLCTQYIYDSIRHYPYTDNIYFHVQPSTTSVSSFLTSHASLLDSSDFILINTIHNNPKAFLALSFKKLTVLRVHNAFKQFSPLSHVRIPFRYFYIRKAIPFVIIEILFRRSLHYFRLLNMRIHYFTFLSQSITNHALHTNLVSPARVIFPIPLLPYEQRILDKPKDKLIISLVGRTDPRRKDFSTVLQAFELLARNHSPLDRAIEIYILGDSSGQYGDRITQLIDTFQLSSFKCYHYKEEVPVQEYDQILQKTHLIIAPLRVKNISQIYEEIYGLTKFPGAIGAIVKYLVIGIFPGDFTFDKHFDDHLKKFSSHLELHEILDSFAKNHTRVEQELQILDNFLATKYNKDLILKNLFSIIEQHKTTVNTQISTSNLRDNAI